MYGEVHFDEHQFVHRPKAVEATYAGDGEWDTTGIAHADLERMHVHRRKKVQQRRLPTPEWAKTKEGIRAVVLNYLESRYYINTHLGTDQERLARIEKAAQFYLPRFKASLDRLMARYKVLAEAGETEAAASLAIQIQNTDKQIMAINRGVAAIVTAVAYSYYCLGWDSVTCAEEYGLTPPNVRILLKRLCDLAPKMVDGRLPEHVYQPRTPRPRRTWDGQRLNDLFALRTSGATWKECARIFGRSLQTIYLTWRRYFGELKYMRPAKVKVLKVKVPKPPKVSKRRWTLEDLEPLYRMRDEERRTFSEIARVMGLRRCQDANRLYWLHLKSFRDAQRNRIRSAA